MVDARVSAVCSRLVAAIKISNPAEDTFFLCVVLVVCCVGSGPCQELICRSQRRLSGFNLWHRIWKCNVCGPYTAGVMNVCHLCKKCYFVFDKKHSISE